DLWDAVTKFSGVITNAKLINALGWIADKFLWLTDNVPGLTTAIALLAAAWGAKSWYTKFKVPGNLNKMTKIFGDMGKDKDGFVKNTQQAGPKIKGFFTKIGDNAKGAATKTKDAFTKGMDIAKAIGP